MFADITEGKSIQSFKALWVIQVHRPSGCRCVPFSVLFPEHWPLQWATVWQAAFASACSPITRHGCKATLTHHLLLLTRLAGKFSNAKVCIFIRLLMPGACGLQTTVLLVQAPLGTRYMECGLLPGEVSVHLLRRTQVAFEWGTEPHTTPLNGGRG